MTPWSVAHEALLFMGFSRQEYWSRLLCPLLQEIFMTERLRCNGKYEHRAQQRPSYPAPLKAWLDQVLPRTPATCSHTAPLCWHPQPPAVNEGRPVPGMQQLLSSSYSLGPVHHPSGPHCIPGRAESCLFILRALCSESTNKTAASLKGDGPGKSSSYFMLPAPKRSQG